MRRNAGAGTAQDRKLGFSSCQARLGTDSSGLQASCCRAQGVVAGSHRVENGESTLVLSLLQPPCGALLVELI
jgi:hypothetical protein